MATGYTAKVQDGKTTDFRVFALDCARAFGALIELRDSPSAAIPTKFEPSTYHITALKGAQADLKRLLKMTAQEGARAAEKDHAESMKHWEQGNKERQAGRQRYEAMLAKAQAWTPPTAEHAGLKKFMVDQLTESIQHDCDGYEQFKPKKVTGEKWLAEQIANAERSIAWHTKQMAEDQKRADDNTAWVRDLRLSLR